MEDVVPWWRARYWPAGDEHGVKDMLDKKMHEAWKLARYGESFRRAVVRAMACQGPAKWWLSYVYIALMSSKKICKDNVEVHQNMKGWRMLIMSNLMNWVVWFSRDLNWKWIIYPALKLSRQRWTMNNEMVMNFLNIEWRRKQNSEIFRSAGSIRSTIRATTKRQKII